MPKRILQGVVVSDKQAKTLVVKVERRFTHPLLKKTVRRTKNTSLASSTEGLETKAPRLGTMVTSPSRSSTESAWRMRARLTPKMVASCSSFSCTPGRSRRSAIDSQTFSTICCVDWPFCSVIGFTLHYG